MNTTLRNQENASPPKFEVSVKTVAEAKTLWRKELSAKDGEIEAFRYLPLFGFNQSSTVFPSQSAHVRPLNVWNGPRTLVHTQGQSGGLVGL
ncbi:hypothetical protein L227DRAFT_579754 [Lentinus tigrinus ALCF2SS1-6]|uniref:Uncharacterized protein n=1 Tax=Lentinus tigrinus ALCF2SS1-6 TaxID=1328759 RepID=A0A5C2RWZ0_9APHY|nr:hypothetical protein L227DRAFT_579754 [Lentinus tigrinus ALCF2SS1-6]